MTAFVTDAFNGIAATTLGSHNADTPASPWTSLIGSDAVVLDGSGAIYGPNDSVQRFYYAPGTPPTADYSVFGVIASTDLSPIIGSGVTGRVNPASSTHPECYLAWFVSGTGINVWQLYAYKQDIGGSGNHAIQLGSDFPQSLATDGTSYQCELRMVGDQISLYVDGVLRIGPITNSVISSAGRAGVAVEVVSSGTSLKMRSFEADPIVVPDAIACTDLTASRIYQRSKGTTAKTITFSGTYTGTAPATVEVKIVQHGTTTQVQDYTALSGATIGGGTWTGTLSVLEGTGSVWYNFLARGKDGGGTVLATSDQTSNKWGVGVLVAMIGQSNSQGMFTASSTPPASHDLTRRYNGSWGVVPGNGAIELANRLRTALDIPIGLLDYGVGSSGLHADAGAGYWMDTAGGSPSVLFEAAAAATGGDYELVVWQQGETDAGLGTAKSQYKADLDSLYARYRTSTGRSTSQLLFGLTALGRYVGAGASAANWDAIRQAELEWSTETPGGFLVGSAVDIALDVTNIHYTAAGCLRLAKRIAQGILYKYGAVAFGANGPRITSAVLIGAVVTVYITQDSGTGLTELDGTTDGGSLTGFEVSIDDFANNLTISSTAFSGNTVQLTLSAPPSDAVKVRYQYGVEQSVTNPVYDNVLLFSDTVGIPLQPSLGSVAVLTRGFSLSPSTIPANHAGEIELVATGIGTTWLDDSEVFTDTGVDSVTITRQVIRSNTDASIFVRTI